MRIPDGGKSYTNNLIDGMMVQSPQTQNFTFLDQFNPTEIQRIDVVRGPGSVLYPSNGIAGAFNLVTKEPSKNPESMLSQEFGTYNYFRTQGATSGTIKSADLGYQAGFSAMEYDPWKSRTQTDRGSVNGKLVYKPDDVSSLTTRLEYNHWYMQNPGALTQAQFNNNWQQANPAMENLYQDFEYLTGAASYKRKFSNRNDIEVSFSRRTQSGIDANPGGGSGASSTTANKIDMQKIMHIPFINRILILYNPDFIPVLILLTVIKMLPPGTGLPISLL